uniref:Uncharacterized protein n=1 Tax=Chrysotila carterae TaxID=13221 RepID=A0A7S4B4V6_CHRCT
MAERVRLRLKTAASVGFVVRTPPALPVPDRGLAAVAKRRRRLRIPSAVAHPNFAIAAVAAAASEPVAPVTLSFSGVPSWRICRLRQLRSLRVRQDIIAAAFPPRGKPTQGGCSKNVANRVGRK